MNSTIWNEIKNIVKDYTEIAAYTLLVVHILGIMVGYSIIKGWITYDGKTKQNRLEIWNRISKKFWKLQNKMILFWIALAILSLLYQLAVK